MGWANGGMGCVFGVVYKGGESPKEEEGGRWKEKVGRSEERGMWAKENRGLVFVAVQLWDENDSQQQKKTERLSLANSSCGFEESRWNL